MEIERKWLVDINNIPYDLNTIEHLDIEQAYISFKPTIRIRKISNINEFVLTIKSSSNDDGLSRLEYEINISQDEYNTLLNKKDGLTLSKTRYRVKEDNYILEIDLFHNEYDGLAYMEIEFPTIEEANVYIPPNWVGKELTYNHNFTNAVLAKGIGIEELFKYLGGTNNMSNNKEELLDKQLETIAGGSRRDKTIVVEVTLPVDRREDYRLLVYVDGTLDSSKTDTIGPSKEKVSLIFNDSRGNKIVKVKLGNIMDKTYNLNFDDGTYSEI